jgi:very-short-patch-repair endonuclease
MSENIKLPLYYGASIEIFIRAETLRKNMTEAEKLLWEKLNHNQLSGFKFRRQHPINQFIVDFYCHKLKLVIELDGEIHNKTEVAERDAGREHMLQNFGLQVIRFKNSEVLKDIDSVITEIKRKTVELSAPNP